MNNRLNTLIDSSIVLGSAVGLAISINDVYNIIGILVLACQLILVCVQLTTKLIESIKNKDTKGVVDTLNEATDKLKELEENKDGKSDNETKK